MTFWLPLAVGAGIAPASLVAVLILTGLGMHPGVPARLGTVGGLIASAVVGAALSDAWYGALLGALGFSVASMLPLLLLGALRQPPETSPFDSLSEYPLDADSGNEAAYAPRRPRRASEGNGEFCDWCGRLGRHEPGCQRSTGS